MRKMIYARLQFGCVDLCAARWFFFIMRAGGPDDARPVIGGRDNIKTGHHKKTKSKKTKKKTKEKATVVKPFFFMTEHLNKDKNT